MARPTKYDPKYLDETVQYLASGKVSGVYALLCPETKQIKYVGQSVDINRRYAEHCTMKGSRNKRSYYSNWINSLSEKPILKILYLGNDLDRMEKFFIAKFKKDGIRIVNTTSGGESYPDSPIHLLLRKMKQTYGIKSRVYEMCKLISEDMSSMNFNDYDLMCTKISNLLAKNER